MTGVVTVDFGKSEMDTTVDGAGSGNYTDRKDPGNLLMHICMVGGLLRVGEDWLSR